MPNVLTDECLTISTATTTTNSLYPSNMSRMSNSTYQSLFDFYLFFYFIIFIHFCIVKNKTITKKHITLGQTIFRTEMAAHRLHISKSCLAQKYNKNAPAERVRERQRVGHTKKKKGNTPPHHRGNFFPLKT